MRALRFSSPSFYGRVCVCCSCSSLEEHRRSQCLAERVLATAVRNYGIIVGRKLAVGRPCQGQRAILRSFSTNSE